MRVHPALALALLATPAFAADTWTDPSPNVRHLSRTTAGPLEYDALVVDLCDPSIELRATKSGERQQTVSSWARSVGAIAAINADFFDFTGYATIGLAVGAGKRWPGSSDGTMEGLLAFGTGGRIELRQTQEALGAPEQWMREVVSGMPSCLVAGAAQFHTDIHFDERHPRTAVGLSADRTKLYLLALDGRSSRSIGVTTQGVGDILKGLGAHDGLNLDGGGSTAMWIAGEGVVNVPSDGTERVVANHLGIMRVAVPENEPSRCCTAAAVAGSTGTFGDLPAGHFALPAAEALYSAGITNGCQASPRLFCPNCRVTRAVSLAFLMRASGVPLDPPATARFVDVPTTHPFFKEIEAAYREGITSGCGNDRFCPDEPASRLTVAIFTARMMGLPTTAPTSPPFTDVPITSSAAGSVRSLVEACVVRGCSADRYCGERTITRAEMAVITARASALVPTGCEPVEQPDAGTPIVDAGTPYVDAGTPYVDAGTPYVDAGPVEIDAGPIEIDAGPEEIDAGTQVDAGTHADAGTHVDAGTATTRDGGAADASVDEPVILREDCECGLTQPAGLALLALFVRRRRR